LRKLKGHIADKAVVKEWATATKATMRVATCRNKVMSPLTVASGDTKAGDRTATGINDTGMAVMPHTAMIAEGQTPPRTGMAPRCWAMPKVHSGGKACGRSAPISKDHNNIAVYGNKVAHNNTSIATRHSM
jgi:hypothetical protein